MKRILPIAAALLVAGCVTTRQPGPPVPATVAFSANSELAAQLSPEARDKLAISERNALDTVEAGEAVEWSVDETERGSVLASQPFRVGRRECRRVAHTVTASDKTINVGATACRASDGRWAYIA